MDATPEETDGNARALRSEGRGREFESRRVRHLIPRNLRFWLYAVFRCRSGIDEQGQNRTRLMGNLMGKMFGARTNIETMRSGPRGAGEAAARRPFLRPGLSRGELPRLFAQGSASPESRA